MTVQEHCEYVDGVWIEKPGETWDHALLKGRISGLILSEFPQYAAGGVTARLSESEYRLPDIAAQLWTVVRQETYALQPPLLCVEILSPQDRLGAMFAKCERYHDWGVPVCWVVDPMQQRA